jgi:hypothetical protein
MIAAVFDCMVFLQAATNDRGPAFEDGKGGRGRERCQDSFFGLPRGRRVDWRLSCSAMR